MESQAQQDSHQVVLDNYIKLLLEFINQSMSSLPSPLFNHNTEFTAEHIDTLLPEQFQHIVGLIFQGKPPSDLAEVLSSSRYQPVPLEPMCHLHCGFNSIVYDGYTQKFYKALRKVFPRGDCTLLPCVVLNPAGDSTRTKKVLKYLTKLMLFVDSLESLFEEVTEQVDQSSLEYEERISRLEELNVQIENRLFKLDCWKQDIPLLQKQSTELTAKCGSLIELAEVTELEVKKLKTDFMQMEERNRLMFQQNESAKAEIMAKNSYLVTNGDALIRDFNFETQKLQALKDLREKRGEEWQVLQGKIAFFDTIDERISSVIQSFKDIVNQMEETAHHTRNNKQLEAERYERVEAVSDIMRKIEHVKNLLRGDGTNVDKWGHSCDQLNIWTKKLDQITKKSMEMAQSAAKEAQVLEEKEHAAAELMKEITEKEARVEKETDDANQDANRRIQEVRQQLREEFGDLLQPKPLCSEVKTHS